MYLVLCSGAVVFILQHLFRLAHVLLHANELSANEILLTLLIGARFDGVIAACFMAVSFLIYVLTPDRFAKVATALQMFWLRFAVAVVLFLEIATFPFFAEYGVRPNRLMFEYLEHTKEVGPTVIALHGSLLLITFFLILAVMWAIPKCLEKFKPAHRCQTLSLTVRIALHLATLGCLILLGRGGLPWGDIITVSRSVFGSKQVANQLALNSIFSVLDAIQTMRYEDHPTAEYDAISMSEDEMFALVKRASFIPPEMFLNEPQNPLLHRAKPLKERQRPLNLVILLEESLGAEYVGSLGGPPLTPHIDALSQEGFYMRRLYSTGTRSARGIEAIITGFLPTPGKAIIKLGLAQKDFFTAAALLGGFGYDTSFIYGGDSAFDNMRSFASLNGFKTIIDQQDYKNPGFKGIWGVSDEDLMIKANDWFKSRGNKPFFSLVFSVSNHSPFEFPDGKIELYEQPKGTVNNAIKYADYALGVFFKLAKREEYFNNTVFLVLADHNWRNFSSDLIPVNKMHIPGLIIAPDLQPQLYDKPCSQIDVLPTVLSLLGFEMLHPMIGHNLFTLPDSYPGRAIMQYDKNHGYLVGDDMIIHLPHKTPLAFQFNGQDLHKSKTPVEELSREASAHALLPGILYEKRLYKPAMSTTVKAP